LAPGRAGPVTKWVSARTTTRIGRAPTLLGHLISASVSFAGVGGGRLLCRARRGKGEFEIVTLKDQACIVGIGTTKFYRRGGSGDTSHLQMMCEATRNAAEDAGIDIADI